ncbi:Uncharacterized membrane protein YuiD [Coccomyxa sp. Obi]|nr:Uncharacterized membrane protein YuiD [Coccomyxa sp. Obi]
MMACVSQEPETRTRVENGRRFRPFIRSLLQKSGPLHTLLSRGLLSCRGPPMLATAATLVLPQLNGNGIGELLSRNYVFKAGFCAWLLAQTAKIFTRRLKQGVWDIRAIVDSGGMPSSHSALCTAVTTAVGLEFGLASSLFAVSLCFTLITMYDATGVRYHSGKQAEVLNILVEDVMQGHPVSEQRLKEVLGHNPLEVIAGSILGVVIGMLTPVPPAIVL